MSKYIVELKPEYEDSFKGLMILAAKDNDLFVDAIAVDDLELLNSDYINEHFGNLQDEAYHKGLADGKEQTEKGCKGCMWEDKDYNTCSICCNSYKNMYEVKKADELKVGDELEHTVIGYTSKAIFLEKIKDDEDWYKCLFWTGCGVTILSYPKRQFKRTGRHFNIDKILEEMKK